MKKIILIGFLLLFLNGCIIYGRGEQAGIVSAIDNGFFWDKVYFKPSLESTQEDNYIISKKRVPLARELRQLMIDKERIVIYYDKHLFTLSEETNDDEIVGYERIKNDVNP